MCEVTMALERHPKLMAELIEVVRMCGRVQVGAEALGRDAKALRLQLSGHRGASDGPAVGHG